MSTNQKPVHLPHLTSLRFFAALAVLFSHLGFLRTYENPLKPLANIFFHEGYSGVTFFFVLSGFILSYTYKNTIVDKITTKKYILGRLARIWPLHFITAIPFILHGLQKQPSGYILNTALNITLLHSWIPIPKAYFSLNAVSWSLSVELFFYTCFIFLAKFPTKTLVKIALTLATIIFGTVAALIFNGNGQWSDRESISISHWISYINPIFRLLDFVVGMLIYRLNFGYNKTTNISTNELFSVSLLFTGMYVFVSCDVPQVLRSQLVYLPLISYIVYSFSSGTGIVSKHLKGGLIVLLGESSFSLYLTHQPIITLADRLYQKFNLKIPVVVFAVLLTILCVVVSVITFKFIEKPLQSYLKRKIILLK